MSIAIVHTNLRTSPTWQQFRLACTWAFLAVIVGCMLYALETYLLRAEHRFVENPADIMTRAAGLAHFAIGWLFLLTSPRLRNGRAIGRLTFCTLVGLGLCGMFTWAGDRNPWAQLAFFSFFFIHETCDEAELFRQSGEIPAETPGVDRFLQALCWSASCTFILTIASAQVLRGHYLGRTAILREFPSEILIVAWLVMAAFTSLTLWWTLRLARSLYGTVPEAMAIYQPLLAIYAGLLAILVVGSCFGSVGTSLVILVHVMTWLVYAQRRLHERDAHIAGVWSWLRQSPSGFLTLHLGLTAVVLVLLALRTHVWQRTGIVCDMVSRSWFPYWSIMHIAMAFWRGK